MGANTRTCWICGKEYEYCPHCRRYQTWKKHSCCPSHYQIEMIMNEFREGVTTKEEATIEFSNIGITEDYDFSNLLPAVARDIKEIIKPVEPVSKTRKANKKSK